MEAKIFDFELGELFLVNKPIKWTSFDVVGKIRACIGQKKIKVGHAGTLDPLADGLLLVCTGKKTKQIDHFQALSKTYTGTLTFGATRPSFDLETEINERFPYEHITDIHISKKIELFTGKIIQISPIYSARRIGGVRAYEKARTGEIVKMDGREVMIHEFEKIKYESPVLSFKVVCSKGTYIRALASDLGKSLESGAYLSQLTRTSIGEYSLNSAWDLGNLCEEILKQNPQKRVFQSMKENKNIKSFPHTKS